MQSLEHRPLATSQSDNQYIDILRIDIQRSHQLQGLQPKPFMQQLAAQIAGQIEALQLNSPVSDVAHYICSSTLDIVSSGGWFEPLKLTNLIQQKTGIKSCFSNAMQCATWGTMLRQHIHNRPAVKEILLSIVDSNPLKMRFWEDNKSWGRTSHRVTLIHLRLPKKMSKMTSLVALHKCNPEVMLYEYAGELQRAAKQALSAVVCAPYFESKMRKGLNRSLREFSHAPDRYEEYGHVCGADPWISVALDSKDNSSSGAKYLLSSIASEGYFCLLRAQVSPLTHIYLEE